MSEALTKIAYRGVEVSWYLQPARARTVIVDGEEKRANWPGTVIGVARVEGRPRAVYVAFWDEATQLPIVTEWFGSRPVCLGDRAAAHVRAGQLDPVDAFWMTGFCSLALRSLTSRQECLYATTTWPGRTTASGSSARKHTLKTLTTWLIDHEQLWLSE